MYVNIGLRIVAILVLAGGGGAADLAGRQASAAEPSGTAVFTSAQAAAGRATYKASCASCHTPDLGGREDAPQLAGDDFISAWKSRKASELYDFIHATMPPEGPALSPEQTVGLVALILEENGAAAGPTPLTATTAAVIGSVATGKRPSPLVAAPAAAVR